jgi:Domain of unknown function (DUF4262)
MCWKCDHPTATDDDYLDELRKTMVEHGWAVQYVESDRAPFAYTVRSGPLVEIVEVANPDAHITWAVAFGGPNVRALQLVWADGHGRWPWAAEFSDGRGRQPVLGVRAQNA